MKSGHQPASLFRPTFRRELDGGAPVPAFETSIRQTTGVREGEMQFTLAEPETELHGPFSRLVAEVEEKLPGDCHRPTGVASRS